MSLANITQRDLSYYHSGKSDMKERIREKLLKESDALATLPTTSENALLAQFATHLLKMIDELP